MPEHRREIDCPRCHEQCGWCSDFRHMHGKLRLPGSNRRCDIAHMHPDKAGCEVCGDTKRVIATTTYAALSHSPTEEVKSS